MPRDARAAKRLKPALDRDSVFLNIPYDAAFERLFLAYISAISAYGLIPRATLEIASSERRLDRILALIERCGVSLHDLSRVQLDRQPPWPTPRFNMPFELGLTVAVQRLANPAHGWFVLEAVHRRALKTLSDLNGTEIPSHGGTVGGIFRELAKVFVRKDRQPTVRQMWAIYRDVRKALPQLLTRSGARDCYNARAFRDISGVASRSADWHVLGIKPMGINKPAADASKRLR